MTDADRKAAAVIAAILARAHGDRHIIAGEIVQALRGHGWQPATHPPPPPAWQQPRQPGTPPTAEWREARQAIAKGGT